MTKEELRKKLRDKIRNAKNTRISKSVREYIEEKELISDKRVSEEMNVLYKKIKSDYPSIDIKPPHYLLDNIQEATENFKKYISQMLELGKSNQIQPEELKYILNNIYTKYMVTVCGIQIVPEKLQFLFTNT